MIFLGNRSVGGADQPIPLDQLISYYSFNTSDGFLNDKVTSGQNPNNHLMNNGQAVSSSAQSINGESANFPDNASAYLEVINNAAFDLSNNKAFSFSFWFRATSISSRLFFINKRSVDSGGEFQFQYEAASQEYRMSMLDTSNPTTRPNFEVLACGVVKPVVFNSWTFACVTTNGVDKIRVQIDDDFSEVVTDSGAFQSIQNDGNKLRFGAIGWSNNNTTLNFRGFMDCIAVFGTELTPLQIQNIKNKGLAGLEII